MSIIAVQEGRVADWKVASTGKPRCLRILPESRAHVGKETGQNVDPRSEDVFYLDASVWNFSLEVGVERDSNALRSWPDRDEASEVYGAIKAKIGLGMF